jgi:tricorn protease
MKTNLFKLFNMILLLMIMNTSAQTININDTRLLSDPAISKTQIAFIYAEDLWIANKDGSNPKRLTVDAGIESNPVFSPDGSLIAFNAQYEGNTDVYIVAATGGVPKRLTYHPYGDLVRGFTPDGNQVLFNSQRNTFTNRYAQLFTVNISNGAVNSLEIPNAFWASYNANGEQIAYTPLSDRFTQWKNYRGGTASRIWIYETKNHAVAEIPKTEGGSNDTQPIFIKNDVYFLSDRNGEFNLFSYTQNNKEVKQLTHFNDFPILNIASFDTEIIFEQAGYLHLFNTNNNETKKIKVGIATDLLEHRPRYVSGNKYIRSAHISPSGNRIVVDFRGDIITIPAKKGDPHNITATTNVHEKFPAWSPNGKYIAYFSDASGEYALHIKNANAEGNEKIINLNGSGFYAYLHWSPNSEKLCFSDNGRSLYITDVNSGKTTKIASDAVYTPGVFRELFGSWSADSNWVSYTLKTETNFDQAYIYNVKENKSYAISDGLSNISNPVFDPSGKYLYMLASTNAGPKVNWFDQSNQDMTVTQSIYLVTLQNSVESPFKKENDIEETETSVSENKSETPVSIDWEGITNRIIAFPLPEGNYSNLQVAKESEIYYLSQSDNKNILHKFDLKTQKGETIMPASNYYISSKGTKMLYENAGKWAVTDVGKKAKEDEIVNTNAVQIKIEPLAEWPNIFNEAWRVNRDYFYDPGMHGADWDAIKEKYKIFLPHLACKNDLYRIMEWMFSELAVGHHRFSSRGDSMRSFNNTPGGLLGADYEVVNNHYRIKKIYGGLNWTPALKSPLTEPGVSIKEGDYILEVNGKPVTATDNFFSFFENTANKLTTLTVSSSPNLNNAKKVVVTPITSEMALRNRDWVEGNMKKVHNATNGRVAYVYVPNTAALGHEYFKRYFFPQADKDAIIVDERFNGGGQLADYYIDMLKKPVQSYWNYRYGKDQKAPNASIQGPKVLLIDETAGSGGDYFPYLFRKNNLGTIVGKTTWGGLVGVLGYPEFIDGGIVTAPNLAFYDENGFTIENEGVAPDIEIEQLPAEVIKGNDPQLEKAIELVLEQLKANPPKKIDTPPYPIRVKN